MPKRGNPTHSVCSVTSTPVPRLQLFKEDRHNLFDILKDADKPVVADYRYRKDEIFKRMKVTTFGQLIVQVAEYENLQTPSLDSGSARRDTADDEVYMIQKGGHDRASALALTVTDVDDGAPAMNRTSRTSTLQGFIKGEGELDKLRGQSSKAEKNILTGCPYLLLDVRDKDSFNSCHIITAQNYPSAMLSRACNYETKDMLAFRNHPGKIIILYDENEQLALNCAIILVQRGYDNVFLLSGGMRVAYKIFPEGLFTGNPPPIVSKTPRSTASEVSANKDRFSNDDLEKIGIYLDNALSDKSSGSRLSKASTASSRMGNNVSSSSKPSKASHSVMFGRVSHQQPFKP